MSQWFGLFFPLKPGSEQAVEELFRTSGRPDHDVRDDAGNVVGKLLRTMVFVGREKAARLIEVEGDLMAVSRHMSRQQEVIALERGLDPHLSEPRDMTTAEGAMEYFARASMRLVLDRQRED